jgi:hypothetical protein
MRGYELMKETLLRRCFINLFVHLAVLALYGILFLPWFAELYVPWANTMLIGSGFILPLIVSAGIFGNDIASGRIAVLVTKPMRAAELYGWRVAGLLAQGAIHFLIAIIIIFALSHITGRGDIHRLLPILLAAFQFYCGTIALSTMISVVVKREFNSVIVLVGLIVIIMTLQSLWSECPDAWVTHWLDQCVKNGLPPIERILRAVKTETSLFLPTLHTLGLSAVYTGVGMLLLSRQQFPQARD